MDSCLTGIQLKTITVLTGEQFGTNTIKDIRPMMPLDIYIYNSQQKNSCSSSDTLVTTLVQDHTFHTWVSVSHQTSLAQRRLLGAEALSLAKPQPAAWPKSGEAPVMRSRVMSVCSIRMICERKRNRRDREISQSSGVQSTKASKL